MLDSTTCHICHQGELLPIPEYAELLQVASDCTPYPKHGKLAACQHCGCIQKIIDDEFKSNCDEIYRNYCVYQQAGGAEQRVFFQNSGMNASRSAVMLEHVVEQGYLPEKGKVLDLGCGNGNLLKSFHPLRPKWDLWGCELHDINKKTVEALPGVKGFHAGDVADLNERFNLITLLHSLEHIVDPISFLSTLKEKLEEDGLLLIEVPNYLMNPFDLVVADHATHFDLVRLTEVVKSAGFEILINSDALIPKELTLLARKSSKAKQSMPAMAARSNDVLGGLNWLASMRDVAREKALTAPLGVFGTSIAGIWILTELGDKVAYFVDEDQNRTGKELFDTPVILPENVKNGSVLLPFPNKIAEGIAKRLKSDDVEFIFPPAQLPG